MIDEAMSAQDGYDIGALLGRLAGEMLVLTMQTNISNGMPMHEIEAMVVGYDDTFQEIGANFYHDLRTKELIAENDNGEDKVA